MGKPAEDLLKAAGEYVELKTDELKLRTTESLAKAFSRFTSVMIIMGVASLVLTACAFGGILLIGDLIGSYAAGAFIVAGFFLVVLAVLVIFRKKMFLNSFTRLFISIFYEQE